MPLAVKNIHATIGEYQRNYLYMVFLEIPSEVSKLITDKYQNFPTQTFIKEVDIYNKSAVFPNRKTDPIKISFSGEFFNIPGVDNSTREADFEFQDDEDMRCYDFFMALKDLTGNEDNQAGVRGIESKFDMGVAKISVDKKTITAYRRLVGTRVYGIEAGDGLKKDANDTSTVKVSVCWDRNVEDFNMRGKVLDDVVPSA